MKSIQQPHHLPTGFERLEKREIFIRAEGADRHTEGKVRLAQSTGMIRCRISTVQDAIVLGSSVFSLVIILNNNQNGPMYFGQTIV